MSRTLLISTVVTFSSLFQGASNWTVLFLKDLLTSFCTADNNLFYKKQIIVWILIMEKIYFPVGFVGNCMLVGRCF